MKNEPDKFDKNRIQRKATRTPERLEEAALDIFSEKSVHAVKLLLKLESDTLDELEEPYLRYLGEIEEQVSIYLSPRIAPLKVRRLACAVAGFVFGFFSFAMIGMTSKEIEISIKPLRRVFVKNLVTFLGR